jgi:hypothetical protein
MSERWTHGFSDWKWSDLLECWTHPGHSEHPYFALGDRMFHQSYGATKDDLQFHGSYTQDWHGGIQTSSFTAALAWLYRANGRDVWAWSK